MAANKRIIILMACLIVTALSLCFVAIHNQKSHEAAIENQLNEKMLQIEEAKATYKKSKVAFDDVRDDAMKNAMGIDGETLSKDMKAITKILTPAYDWKNNQEYDAARSTLEKTLPKDSAYLERILVDRNTYNKDGTIYNLDEQGLKCSCEAVRTYPAYVDKNGERVYHVVLDYISYKDDAIERHDHLTVDRQVMTVHVNDKEQIVDIELEQCDSIVNYRTVK